MFVNENAFQIRAASLLKTLIEQELPGSHDAAASATNAEFGGSKASGRCPGLICPHDGQASR